MHELLDLLHCVTRKGRETSEFLLALVYIVAVPIADAIVSALLDVLHMHALAAVYASPAVYLVLMGLAAGVVSAYALGRSYVKGKTAAAAARAVADIHTLGRGGYSLPDTPAPVDANASTASTLGG